MTVSHTDYSFGMETSAEKWITIDSTEASSSHVHPEGIVSLSGVILILSAGGGDEDIQDAIAAREALEESDERIPYGQIRRELGLK